jgi:outer membrane autotransporter protein
MALMQTRTNNYSPAMVAEFHVRPVTADIGILSPRGEAYMRSDFQVVAKPNNTRALRLFQAALMSGTMLSTIAMLPTSALANSECGPFTPTIACGQGPFNNGITYDNAQTSGPTQIGLINSQVANGLFISSNQSGESVLVDISTIGVGPLPNITNAGSFDTDGAVQVQTSGNNAPVTINFHAGTIAGNNGSFLGFPVPHEGIFVSTSGTNSPINVTTDAGTGVTSLLDDGVELQATGGSNINAIINGSVVSTAGTSTAVTIANGLGVGIGVKATATGGNGNVGVTVGSTGTVSGGLSGITGSAVGTGNVTIDTSGAVSQTNSNIPISFAGLPTGISGTAVAGDVKITTHSGGTVGALAPTSVGVSGHTTSGAVILDTGDTVTAGGGGVVGDSTSGDVSVTNRATVTTTGVALVGVSSTSATGAASTTVKANIVGATPGSVPLVGATANVTGAGATRDATLNVDPNVTVNAREVGLLASNAGSGLTTIKADSTSTTNSTLLGVGGFGTGSGNVNVDAGTVNVTGAGGLGGVLGLSTGTGNVVVNANNNVNVESGLFGVASVALGGNAEAHINGNINSATGAPAVGGSALAAGNATLTVADGKTVNATDLGLFALSGNGNADTEGVNSTVTSAGSGAVSVALNGNSTINLGAITAANGSAAVSTAIGGDSNVTTYGLVQATNGGGLISTAIGGDANATSNANVSITNGLAGVAAFAINGDATAQNNAEVSVTNGFVGVGAVSIGGDATATANGNIDPPFIGVSAFTIGSGTAHSIVNDYMSVQADGIGVFGGNIGTGTVDIDVGNEATVSATPGLNGVGIAALKLGDGNVTIDVGTNTTVTGDSFGVTALALGSGNDTVAITNQGTLTNRNGFVPTIFSITDGGTSIDNQSVATIKNGSGFAFSPIIATIGGQLTVNNTGTMIGSMSALTLNGGNNVINNNYGGEWTTSGLNFFATGGDNVINNNPGGHINSLGFSVFAFADGGTSTVNNSSEFFVNGVTSFIGLENFNNAGGQLDMQDGHTNDATFMTGNFNGGPNSKLAIDAQLGSNSGFFLADFLGIGGNTTPATGVKINDTTPYTPGSYNPDGIIFALVAGNTANGDFYANNGPIDKGLFSYDVFLNPDFKGQGFDAWVIASTPDATFFELPHIVSAAQSMWNQSTGVWLDRTADLRTALMGGCSQVSLKDESGPCAPGLKSAVWAKGWGFNEDRDRNNSFELHDRTLSYNIDSNQTGFGVVGGVDLVRGQEATPSGNSAWVIGVLGGYTHSDLDFHKSTTDVNFDGGTVGAYATYLNGGWFVDSKFSADIGNMDYSNSAGVVHASDSADFASYGFTIDGGYRTNIGFGTFIEPGATLSYVATNVDSIKIYGSNVDFDNGNSLRGRLGVRVGTSFISDSYRVEPFLGIAGWYEFEGDNQASVTNNGYTLTATDDLKGLSGDLSGGVNLFTLDNSGTSAFAKGDFTFGQDNLIGVSGQIGVRVGW